MPLGTLPPCPYTLWTFGASGHCMPTCRTQRGGWSSLVGRRTIGTSGTTGYSVSVLSSSGASGAGTSRSGSCGGSFEPDAVLMTAGAVLQLACSGSEPPRSSTSLFAQQVRWWWHRRRERACRDSKLLGCLPDDRFNTDFTEARVFWSDRTAKASAEEAAERAEGDETGAAYGKMSIFANAATTARFCVANISGLILTHLIRPHDG